MKTKVYHLTRHTAAFFQTKYCGVIVPLTFAPSAGVDNKSSLTTTDRFIQDAIENDPRYGTDFYLAETIDDGIEQEPPKKKPKKRFTNINDAVSYLEELGVDVSNGDIDEILQQNNVVVKSK